MKLILGVIFIIVFSLNLTARENGETEITTEDGIEVFQNEKFYLLKKNVKIESDEFTLKSVSGLTLESNDSSTQRRLFLSNGSLKPYNADDNTLDLGTGVGRWDDVFATNGTIQTSDQNEKQDIASATTKELNVAKKLSALFKTFRWKDKVTEKGDKARTHTGIVAQEIQSVFSAEGLDVTKYGLFTSTTWWEKEISVDAVEADEEKGIEAKDAYTKLETFHFESDAPSDAIKKTRLGVRYPELFSFIFSSIEARLTALESK